VAGENRHDALMSSPQDPFTSPSGQPDPTPGYGSAPGYGAAPAYGSAPDHGSSPAYGEASYGAPPGGPGGRPDLASWGLRVGGYLIDAVILTVVGVLVTVVLGDALANLVYLALYYGVFGYLTGTTGQTPGRKVVGITVLREQDGQHLGAGMGIVRNICHILDALPLFLGFLWPLWDGKNQTFADKIVKSVVVKA
jgi:uncharacterized RDD family membrane protein YckC